ncbi:hypothetical protein V8C35DRAFT_116491 [Trichoderma chlorosporum]
MDMLFDGICVPKEQDDGLCVWANPASDGKIPSIALEDVRFNNLWTFDNPHESAGLDLEVATDQVSMLCISETFTRVTGKKALHRRLPLEEYLQKAEPYPNAPVSWAAGPNAVRAKSIMT